MNHSESSEPTKQTSSNNPDNSTSDSKVIAISSESRSTDVVDAEDTPKPAKSPSSSRQKRNLWLASGAIALVLGAGVGWYWWQNNAQQQTPPSQTQPQALPVRLSTVETATVEESAEYVANLESRQSVVLLPQIQGRVSRIFVNSGDEVQAGAAIIQIDPEEQQAAVSSASAAAAVARAQVENARANLRALEAERISTQSNLRLSQQQYERYSSLADQGAVSRETRDQYFNELQAARSSLAAINKQIEAQQAAVAQSQKAVQQAEANVKQSQVQLQYYQINAPFAGTVGNIPVRVGDLVTTSTQLTTVTQNQPLEVNISIPLQQATRVQVGTTLELLDARGQQLGTSKVTFISPRTASDTQSVLIKALFDNAKGQLRADSFVRTRVILDRSPGILVPTEAISRLGGQAFVYVAEPTESESGRSQLIARQKPVELGAIQGNSYQVRSGLQPGERIITSGLLNLRDGVPVVPAPEPETEEQRSRGAEEQRGRGG
jgi:RND family efflux transporter MFP subunit